MSDNITIVSLDDLSSAQLTDLKDSYNKNFLFTKRDNDYFKNFKSDKKRSPFGFFIFYKNQCVGMVIGRSDLANKKNFNLDTLFVATTFRERGLAKMLMEKFLTSVWKEKDIAKIYLHFRDPKLKAFYSEFGFDKYKTDGFYENGDIKYFMELEK